MFVSVGSDGLVEYFEGLKPEPFIEKKKLQFIFSVDWFIVLRPKPHRLVSLVVTAPASRAEDPGFKSHLRRDFPGVESYWSLKN